jgi:hypothetical protein
MGRRQHFCSVVRSVQGHVNPYSVHKTCRDSSECVTLPVNPPNSVAFTSNVHKRASCSILFPPLYPLLVGPSSPSDVTEIQHSPERCAFSRPSVVTLLEVLALRWPRSFSGGSLQITTAIRASGRKVIGRCRHAEADTCCGYIEPLM